MNLDNIDNMFFIGIGGMGMSSLAEYFVNEKKYVGGYDRDISENTNRLQKLGIEILFNDSFDEVEDKLLNKESTLVVFTPAIPNSNNLLTEFRTNNYRCIKRAELLGLVAVSYTHLRAHET